MTYYEQAAMAGVLDCLRLNAEVTIKAWVENGEERWIEVTWDGGSVSYCLDMPD